MRPRWVSYSSLTQFLQCERQWYYKRILKWEEAPSHYLAIGNLYHAMLEHMVKECELECLESLFDDLYVIHASRPDWKCASSEKTLKKEVIANCRRVCDNILDPLVNAGAVLTPEKHHKYLAKIDLLTSKRPKISMGELVGVVDEPGVLDYKIKFSTNNRRTQADAEFNAQLAIYCILEDVRWAGFVEIPRSTKASVNIIAKSFTDEELKQWARYFDEQKAAIDSRKTSNYTGHGDDGCNIEHRFRLADPANRLCSEKWCPFWDKCPGGGK